MSRYVSQFTIKVSQLGTTRLVTDRGWVPDFLRPSYQPCGNGYRALFVRRTETGRMIILDRRQKKPGERVIHAAFIVEPAAVPTVNQIAKRHGWPTIE